MTLRLLSTFLGAHLLYVLLHIVGGSQATQGWEVEKKIDNIRMGSDFWVSSKKSQDVPFRASSSHCLVMSRYLGDSGQTGNSSSCSTAGHIARPSRTGQPSLVPRIGSMPSTWDKSSPTVTASWLTVPRPPRKLRGAISLMYMGTNEVFSPQLTPIMNRPRNSISYELLILVKPIRQAPDMPSTLLSSSPPFLRGQRNI